MRTFAEYAKLVEARLQQLPEPMTEGMFSIGTMPWLLSESMRYSLLAGGKRLRGSMFLACAELFGVPAEEVIDFACAVEMIHAYSLIHDDLPGMDNDTMRRGKPTNHIVFGEGQAILAGDGLLNFAFETMLRVAASHPEKASSYLLAIREIARGAGVAGMIGGQVLDLYSEHKAVRDVSMFEYIQVNKTACMFAYPLRAAGRLCGASAEQCACLENYGTSFGLLFQAVDDLLDVEGDAALVGKTLGKDAESDKLTCISVYGLEGTKERVKMLCEEAKNEIRKLGKNSEIFVELVDKMAVRDH